VAEDHLGPHHIVTLWNMNGLEQAYVRAGKRDLAGPLTEELFKRHMAVQGPEHPQTLLAMANLASRYWGANQLDKAVSLFEQALTKMKATLSLSHPNTRLCLSHLASVYQAQGKYDRAVDLLEEQLNWLKAKQTPESDGSLLAAMHNLADAYREAGRPEPAVPLYEEEIRLHIAKAGADNVEVASQAKNGLGLALLLQRKYTEAEPLLLKGYEILAAAKLPARYRVRLTQALERLVQLYDAQGQKDKADQWRKKLEETKATVTTPAKP
jgi:tetratricopeptide (TPR) repeat protein